MAVQSIKVTGAKELRKSLRALGDRELLRELGKVNNRVAQVVVTRARGNASTDMEQAAAGRLRASRGASRASVTLGGKPYDLGAEFGAMRNQQRTRVTGTYLGLNQFKPWKRGEEAGYFLFPAIRESRDELIDQYAEEIEALFKKGTG